MKIGRSHVFGFEQPQGHNARFVAPRGLHGAKQGRVVSDAQVALEPPNDDRARVGARHS
jgi:hypothetical protein